MKTASEPGREQAPRRPRAGRELLADQTMPPRRFAVLRVTHRNGKPTTRLYDLPDGRTRVDQAAFRQWQNGSGDPGDFALSLLVIEETLDDHGLIAECAIESRRGDAAGPYGGTPARIEFLGPARWLRHYRVGRDGRLAEYPPEPPDDAASGAVERQWGAFAGEEAALAAYFGVPPHILDRRPPTLFEGVVGLTTIYRVRPAEAEVTCGVGWHGTVPFVLVADFPGLSGASGLSPDEQDLIDAALSTQGLMAVQTRHDDRGPAVIARAETTEALSVIRVIDGKADIQPYQPGDGETGTDDQRRWIRYAESIEGLTILDAWNDGLTDDLVVVTRGPQGDINRHYIDPDGVEVGRDPDPDAPAAQLMPDGSLPPDLPDLDGEEPAEDDLPVPPNSVLALHHAAIGVFTALRQARDAVDATDPEAARNGLATLRQHLFALDARLSAAAVDDVLGRAAWSDAAIDAPTLNRIETRVRDELSQLRILVARPPAMPLSQTEALDRIVPDAGFHMQEAVTCLMFRRPTAAVLHGMRVMRGALTEMGRRLDWPEPDDARWTSLLSLVRAERPAQPALAEAIDRIRRVWGAPGLLPADRYSEEAAEAVLAAVAHFLTVLATLPPPA